MLITRHLPNWDEIIGNIQYHRLTRQDMVWVSQVRQITLLEIYLRRGNFRSPSEALAKTKKPLTEFLDSFRTKSGNKVAAIHWTVAGKYGWPWYRAIIFPSGPVSRDSIPEWKYGPVSRNNILEKQKIKVASAHPQRIRKPQLVH